jgi:hypothetical protein
LISSDTITNSMKQSVFHHCLHYFRTNHSFDAYIVCFVATVLQCVC